MMITLFIVVLFILSVIFLSYYFKSMITISKVFFIFLSISLGLFILFIGYLFFNKESSEVVKSGNNLDAIAASTVPGSPGSPASHHGSHLASI
jgi:surface polysaccharide O-acyltransferase-like enzyme